LAIHSERGQDRQRAVAYLRQAADTALRLPSQREAIGYLERALALLPTLSDGAERAIAIATEYGFLSWQSACTIVRGYALVEQGQRQEGIAQIRQGLANSLVVADIIRRDSSAGEQREHGVGNVVAQAPSVAEEHPPRTDSWSICWSMVG